MIVNNRRVAMSILSTDWICFQVLNRSEVVVRDGRKF